MDQNRNKHLELLAPERIIDLADQGFVLELDAPMMVITRDLGGTITTQIYPDQYEALKRVLQMEAGFVHQYWEEDTWKAGDRLTLDAPELSDRTNEQGMHPVVLHFNRIIH
ncbi:hypothetical protein [Deinococcus cellulosilyticus]|uniref:Uncharacterized protein n=1 Tax=Deinococcus cellulosilyticus (strain DSM 18568 / NBRC 106333 / KACC 11606 / 5516J-15) TaxID=1223518 RepID=A0A511N2F9_DEIC1|nr:hypothetical protein [Deinococcus cellulosilyticus]GEM47044.1 hypothetical protein DC3_26790 [Deinococcus cellulosilyticus NBRC 106333 = KACC 11606]